MEFLREKKPSFCLQYICILTLPTGWRYIHIVPLRRAFGIFNSPGEHYTPRRAGLNALPTVEIRIVQTDFTQTPLTFCQL